MKFKSLLGMSMSAAICVGAVAGAKAEAPIADDSPVFSQYGNYLAGRYAASQMNTSDAVDFIFAALDNDPDNLELLREALTAAVLDGRNNRISEMARRVAKRDDESGLAQLVLILDEIKAGDYGAANKRAVAAVELGLSRQVSLVTQAWTHAARGDLDLALVKLEDLRQLLRHRQIYRLHRAAILEYSGSTGEALEEYREGWKETGGRDSQLSRAYRRLLERTGRDDELLAVLNTEISRFADEYELRRERDRILRAGDAPVTAMTPATGLAELMHTLGRAMLQNSAYSAAAVYLRLALYLNSDDTDVRLLIGDVLHSAGDDNGALAEYAKIGAASPLYLTARTRRAIIHHAADRSDEAMAELNRLSAAQGDDPEILSTMADLLRDLERFEESAAVLSQLIEQAGPAVKEDWVLFYARGIAYERAGNWPAAEADFLKALELNERQPDVLNYLGYSWIEQGKNLQRARAMIEDAVDQMPTSGYIVDSLGWAMYQLGEYEDAVKTLERAVLLLPSDPTINEHLGDAYWKVDRKREARFQWRHALALEPEKDKIAGIEQKLQHGLASLE